MLPEQTRKKLFSEGNFVQPGNSSINFPRDLWKPLALCIIQATKGLFQLKGYWRFVVLEIQAVLYLHWLRMHLGLTTGWNDRILLCSIMSYPDVIKNSRKAGTYTSLSTCEPCSNCFCLNCQIPTEIRNRPGNSRRSFQVAQARLAGLHESAITLARHSSGSDWSCTKGPGCLLAGNVYQWFSLLDFYSSQIPECNPL